MNNNNKTGNSNWNKVLFVDLSAGETFVEEISPQVRRDYLGGKGLATWYLEKLTRPLQSPVDPLGEDSPLIFAAGPLTGTAAPAMRGLALGVSPLTGGYVDSYYGGHFAQEIKYCGFDALVITGKAKSPVLLKIEDAQAELVPAQAYWGLDTFQANHQIKEDFADPTWKIATIGPAGENQVPYALISCEYNRHAGRGGLGAVMGSKLLKAVALKGTHPVGVADPDTFTRAVEQAREQLLQSPDIQALTECGTAATLWFSHEQGLLPVENYQKGTFDPAGLAEDAQRDKIWLRDTACASCPIRCSKVGVIRRGRRKSTVTDIVEYETAALMGANLGLSDIQEVAYLVYLCDALGLDGMSCGSVLGFAMECFEAGLLKPQDGISLAFGQKDYLDQVIEQIACRRGDLGQLLALGTARAAEKLGAEAEEKAVHVKNMDIPAFGPRSTPGMALAYLTADRGACHQRGFPINYEVLGEPFQGRELDRLAIKGKAPAVVHDQNYLAALDTLVKCDFGSFGISEDVYRALYQGAVGEELSQERLMQVGERIWNLSRRFNLRQGLDYSTEKLPKRFRDPLPDGPFKGHAFSREDEEIMLQEYYACRGWDSRGVPTPEKIEELGI